LKNRSIACSTGPPTKRITSASAVEVNSSRQYPSPQSVPSAAQSQIDAAFVFAGPDFVKRGQSWSSCAASNSAALLG
jgi:hypothetical protein